MALVKCIVLAALVLSPLPALADDPARLPAAYVRYVEINSTDQPDLHEDYFSHLRLLNDFSRDFVAVFTAALDSARRREDATLFEEDPLTGDANRCPIGRTTVAAAPTEKNGTVKVDAHLDNTVCNGSATTPGTGVRLRFTMVLEGHAGKAGRYVIDDIEREGTDGTRHTLKGELRAMAR